MTRIAVTGSTGRLGGQVSSQLSEHPGVDVLPMTRAMADYGDRLALTAALAEVDVLVLVSSDGEAELVLQHHLNIAAAVAANSVPRVVALSSVDADAASPFCYARVNALTERALEETGTAVTAVRASIYTEFFDSLVELATVDGEVRLPAADGRVSLVAREDVGRCLAAAALAPDVGAYDVTGPAALDMTAVAAARGAAYVPVSEAEFMGHLAGRETPWWSYAYTSMFASIRQQRWDVVSDGVERLTGRPAVPAVQPGSRRR